MWDQVEIMRRHSQVEVGEDHVPAQQGHGNLLTELETRELIPGTADLQFGATEILRPVDSHRPASGLALFLDEVRLLEAHLFSPKQMKERLICPRIQKDD